MIGGPDRFTLSIWAVTSFACGQPFLFWPIFVILPMIFGGFTWFAHYNEIIRHRKRELTTRARAHLGDADAKRELEQEDRSAEDFESDLGRGLQPPHPPIPPYSPGQISRRDEQYRRRTGRRHHRDNPWD